MKRRTIHEDALTEAEVRITWRQWHDGCWEAWVSDNTGRSPHLVRDRAELERFPLHAYRRERENLPAGPDFQDD